MYWLISLTIISIIATILFFLLSNRVERNKRSFNILCWLTILGTISTGTLGIVTIIMGSLR